MSFTASESPAIFSGSASEKGGAAVAAFVDANGDNLPVFAFFRPQQRHHFITAIAQLSAKRHAIELPFVLLTALSLGLNALLVLSHVRRHLDQPELCRIGVFLFFQIGLPIRGGFKHVLYGGGFTEAGV